MMPVRSLVLFAAVLTGLAGCATESVTTPAGAGALIPPALAQGESTHEVCPLPRPAPFVSAGRHALLLFATGE